MAMGVGSIALGSYIGANGGLGWHLQWTLPPILPQIGAVVGYNLLRKSPNDIREQGCLPLFPESRVCSKNSGIKVILLNIKF